MRHGKKTNHLSRKTAHRSALLSNMACSLIEHKRINTTLAKAKALRIFIEPIITKSKNDSTHNRRIVFRYLKNKDASSLLFRDIAPKINDRPGGYTRIIKMHNRLGDNAEMAMIELVDFNDLLTKDKVKKKKTRRRGGKKPALNTSKNNENPEVIEDAELIEETTDVSPVKDPTIKVESSDKNSETTEPPKKEK